MIPKECKRLAEVDFPIAVVSKHSAREKSIRHGHPSTLHLWWARRPLAACRAMLMALLLPDPADPHCPEEFKVEARKLLAPLPVSLEPDDDGLRRTLLKFIGDFSNWDLSNNSLYIETARSLIKVAHGDEIPLVVDPFAGGGSIPLEALRLGCETFASDLNPVACMILKVMLEDIPRHGPELVEELRRVGEEIKEKAEKELAEFYPPDPDGAKPIAYLWARTVKCESPHCGAEIPLMRSFWLCKKENRKKALRYTIKRPEVGPPNVEFEIFEPKNDKEVPNGTVTRAKAKCLCCNSVLPPERVRAQLSEQQGGADVVFDSEGNRIGGARILSVVTLHPGIQGRVYRLPDEGDYEFVWKAQERIKEILDDWERLGKKDLCPIPDESLPPIGTLGFRVQRYGMIKWRDLFTARQKIALVALAKAIARVWQSEDAEYPTMAEILSFCISKRADYASSLTKWHLTFQKTTCTFGRQALPITWDFVEPSALGNTSGAYGAGMDTVLSATSILAKSAYLNGQVQQTDAAKFPLPCESASIFFTDPPYYDAIPYSDLSDYFLVWLKRTLPGHASLSDPFERKNPLSPKTAEIVQDETKQFKGEPKGRNFFEVQMAKAFAEGRRVLKEIGIGSVVFAHKTTEGWEALLSGIINGGWTVTGSWPIATERPGRLRSQLSASLATSVHLVCRPRPDEAPLGNWDNILHEIPNRVVSWMKRLQGEGIRGADLVFACIGPALEIYSRYSEVVDAEDRKIPLGGDPMAAEPYKRGFLAYVWEAIGRAALEQILGTAEAKAGKSETGSLEEDARLTALFLWTLQSTNGNNEGKNKRGKSKSVGDDNEEIEDFEGDNDESTSKPKPKGFSLIFDVVRRFAQPLGIRLPDWEGRIIKTEKGVVRLLPVKERAKQLFGETGAQAVADQLETSRSRDMQLRLFPVESEEFVPKIRGGGGKGLKSADFSISDEHLRSQKEATTLDRVHAAMLLQASGRANALRALLKAEVERGPDFLRLANALSALYPKSSEEKRLLDAMLLVLPR